MKQLVIEGEMVHLQQDGQTVFSFNVQDDDEQVGERMKWWAVNLEMPDIYAWWGIMNDGAARILQARRDHRQHSGR
jgi:hypothetical protein